MLGPTFTLVLTKGTHVISAAAAAAILAALREREAIVSIALHPYGGVDADRITTLAVRHVVALTPNSQPSSLARAESSFDNVAPLRRAR